MSRRVTIGVLFGYKTVLHVLAFLLTFSIRKVKLKGLNDAKYIAMAVYTTNFVTAVIIVSFYTLEESQNLFAALFSVGILCGTTAILALIFIPKVIPTINDIFFYSCTSFCNLRKGSIMSHNLTQDAGPHRKQGGTRVTCPPPPAPTQPT